MGWHDIMLGDLIEVKHGFAFKGEFFSDEGHYILLTPGNCHVSGGLKLKGEKEKFYIGDFPKEYLLSAGDLIVVMTDLVNSAPILGGALTIPEDGRFLHNQRMGLIRVTKPDRIDKKFLYYLLNTNSYRNQVRGSASGATVRHTSPDRIKQCKVRIPDTVVEQRHIASILSAYDDLIENNRRRTALLERAARLLYREWFIHLRFPGHEHIRMKNSFPDEWESKMLGEIANITMGQSPKSVHYNENGVGLPFHQGVTNFGERFPSHQIYCTSPSRLAESNDILFSVRAPVGRINITPDKIVIGRGIAAIRSNQNQQNFLFYTLKNHFFKEDLIGGGAIFSAVTKKDLYRVELMQPPDVIVNMFTRFVNPIDHQISILQRIIDRLGQSRDAILPRLMNGEMTV